MFGNFFDYFRPAQKWVRLSIFSRSAHFHSLFGWYGRVGDGPVGDFPETSIAPVCFASYEPSVFGESFDGADCDFFISHGVGTEGADVA